MTVYKNINECSGCRLCENVCPEKCIKMEINDEGFIYPVIDSDKCIGCGICTEKCPALGVEYNSLIRKAYAAKSTDEKIHRNSSSGGLFLTMCKKIFELNGVVFGAVFDSDWNVVHVSAETFDEAVKMSGSKYVQSDTLDTYREAKEFLDSGRWVLYSGTPCQISALKEYLSRDYERLVLVSLICHGVPSPLVWKMHLEHYKSLYPESKITDIRFRDNSKWGELLFSVKYDNGRILAVDLWQAPYYRGFLRNLYLRPSCHSCNAKKREDADLVIGDYWGIKNAHKDFYDEQGVSAVIAFTQKGNDFFGALSGIEYIESEYELVKRGNVPLTESAELNPARQEYFDGLRKNEYDIGSFTDTFCHPIQKISFLYPTTNKYLSNNIKGKSFGDFLASRGNSKVAFYAVNELTVIAADDISKCGNARLVCICDKKYDNFPNTFCPYDVCGLEKLIELYNSGSIDGVIIFNMTFCNEIRQELAALGIPESAIMTVSEAVNMWSDLINAGDF